MHRRCLPQYLNNSHELYCKYGYNIFGYKLHLHKQQFASEIQANITKVVQCHDKSWDYKFPNHKSENRPVLVSKERGPGCGGLYSISKAVMHPSFRCFWYDSKGFLTHEL